MPEEELTGTEQREVSKGPNKLLIGIGAGVVALVVVFMLGFGPMWWKSHKLGTELATTQNELRINKWQNALATAAIDARRGEYESARQSASKFFSEVSSEMVKTSDSAFTTAQTESLKGVLAPRDEIITLLARNDPVAADKLTAMHVAFRTAVAPSTATEK
ncbi:MAG: hypothetical protein ABIP75_19720 [Pyrinomonadaceae bacterium]